MDLVIIYSVVAYLPFLSALSTVLIAQNSPHMLQTSVSVGGTSALHSRTLSGLRLMAICPFQSKAFLHFAILISASIEPLMPFAISAAWAASFETMTPSLTSSMLGSLICSAGVT